MAITILLSNDKIKSNFQGMAVFRIICSYFNAN